MNRTDVQGTVADMWETRPARPRQDRKVAGVAAAIARRYDVDPVLVRVGFVAAAFTGVGAALYIAGWAALPGEPADPTAPAPRRVARGFLVAGLAFAALIGLGSLFDGDSGGGGVLALIAVAALLFALHRSRGDRGPVPVAPPVAPTGTGRVSLVKGDGVSATPPAWDPLGAAPFAWDLPEPAPPPPVPAPRRPPVTPVTLGLALLATAATAAIMLISDALTPDNVPGLLGVALTVIGGGLLVGAFVRAGRGLIPVALLLSALTWAAVAAPLDRWEDDGMGDLRVAPATAAALLPSYERAAGNIDLDLRGLDLTAPPGAAVTAVRTSVSLGAGDVQVWVPRDADLTLTGAVGIGQLSFGDREESGAGSELRVTDDLGADGVRSGRPLVLDVEAGAGNVEVRRG